MLVSSRFFGYEEAPLTAPAVQMAVVPFDNEQIRVFARQWCAWLEKHLHGAQANLVLAAQHAAQFEKVVLARPQITDLARNPLLLTMIAVVLRQGKRLPERRVELYDQALGQLMTQWEFLRMAARGDTTPLFSIDYNDACQLWAPLARWMHEGGTGAVHEEELKQRLKTRLQELDREETAQDWLAVRGDKCCLLQERGDKLFSFLHQTFQEYLAAMDLYQGGQFVDDLERYIADPRWHEVLRLTCGYLGVICRPPRRAEVTALLQRIKNQPSPQEALLHQNLFLAASCLADDVKSRRDIEQAIVQDLLSLARSPAMDQQRLEAMRLLVANARIPTDEGLLQEVAPVLLRDEHWQIRYLFAQWLDSRSGSSAGSFLAQLGDDRNANVCGLALALSWRRNPTQALLEQVLAKLGSMMADLRLEVDHILLQKSSHLVVSLETDESGVRLEAARLLLDTEERPPALRALVALLQAPDSWVRLEAARLLRDTEERPLALHALVAWLQAPESLVRLQAARLLWMMADTQAGANQLVLLLTGDDPALRRYLADRYPRTSSERSVLPEPGENLPLLSALQEYLPETLAGIGPGDRLYEAAWLYATLSSSNSV